MAKKYFWLTIEPPKYTVDHSYYLNRALMDGYFLSGIAENKEATLRDSTALGEATAPFCIIKITKVGESSLSWLFPWGRLE